jgi:guanylate kinase
MPEVDRAAASAAAVTIRRKRAAIKLQIAAGERSPVDVAAVAFADASTVEASIRVRDFLKALPSVGVTKVPVILDELEISDKKRLGGLGKHQRVTLARYLNAFVARRNIANQPKLVVLAGPAGVGKGTVANPRAPSTRPPLGLGDDSGPSTR